MKTTIEIGGVEILIEETDGVINVSALKDGETIEEFEVNVEGEETEDDEDEGDDESEEPTEEEEEPKAETKLESFSSFLKRRK